jgi:uncharacterized protein (DUF2141 family)
MTLFVLFSLNLFKPVLSISFTNIKEAKGSLYVGVYKSEADFMKEEKACLKKIIPVATAGNLDLDVSELGPGTYAISCFHDVNDNGKLDTNLLGIPSEPYGFSNNARPKFRAPNWSETKFEVKTGGSRISIRLEKW